MIAVRMGYRGQGMALSHIRAEYNVWVANPLRIVNFALCLGALALPLAAQSGACSGMTVGQLTSLNGFVPFPADNLWNSDISAAPVDANSANYINYIGATAPLHPDFGAGNYQGSSIGIPYQVVAGT